MMKKCFVILCALAFCSCSSSKYKLSAVITDASVLRSDKTYENGPDVVRGDSLAATLLFMPTGSPSIEDAVKNAAAKCEGNCIGLSDVLVEHNVNNMLLLFGSNSVTVTGYPIIQK